ncbi:UNVERIFIED_CONTAM: hypothetical protein HDU68_002141 [Siphonaria sp. JEL0065]|nr:hypothetical protein HDU68_002141 [Siphonaria sp. JEL0065]
MPRFSHVTSGSDMSERTLKRASDATTVVSMSRDSWRNGVESVGGGTRKRIDFESLFVVLEEDLAAVAASAKSAREFESEGAALRPRRRSGVPSNFQPHVVDISDEEDHGAAEDILNMYMTRKRIPNSCGMKDIRASQAMSEIDYNPIDALIDCHLSSTVGQEEEESIFEEPLEYPITNESTIVHQPSAIMTQLCGLLGTLDRNREKSGSSEPTAPALKQFIHQPRPHTVVTPTAQTPQIVKTPSVMDRIKLFETVSSSNKMFLTGPNPLLQRPSESIPMPLKTTSQQYNEKPNQRVVSILKKPKALNIPVAEQGYRRPYTKTSYNSESMPYISSQSTISAASNFGTSLLPLNRTQDVNTQFVDSGVKKTRRKSLMFESFDSPRSRSLGRQRSRSVDHS